MRDGELEGQGLEALSLILSRAWSSATFLFVLLSAIAEKEIPHILVSLGALALAAPVWSSICSTGAISRMRGT